MKATMIAAAGFLALALPAVAQTTPSSNATVLGTQTAPSNSAGMPSAATPQGQVATTGAVTASPPGTSAARRPGSPTPATTADSTTTGTTTAPAK